MRYLNQLTKVDISGCKWVTGKTLDTIVKHAQNLRYVHIRNCLKLREKDISTQQKKNFRIQKFINKILNPFSLNT